MAKGAVWLRRGSKEKRLRRATAPLMRGDVLSLHYDEKVLAAVAADPTLLADERQYSVWIKPAGVLAQGTRTGDHCALLRLVEAKLGRETFLVHRLDREAAGLMLIAHNAKAAAALSDLFARRQLEKTYRVDVRGRLPETGQFDAPLDGKPSRTTYHCTHYDADSDCSTALVQIESGRKHQIRRHFADAGFPVLGDPRYGQFNSDSRGLRLAAIELRFRCPLSGRERHYQWRSQ
ncbi:RNA pseudouridine synthase [Tahibacter amnicola]|uniref:RNA pseudouridine synthase n=1 Tax=Tahibacter amnicola TaxID=2976241 RepID=A0ABY6B912_9GAMM|nr:RNA pseudouridine synthase [Tahibacter amnicola]UXI66546.1 RNA pseudouridine synthase [Tahibacter amnicola]